ncbi:AT-hook motif nuclear-localized protein 14-like [Chenopodium quinoa]|uniref:AT-hook motif nuclear-localized protein 14-like n=1 Tax=Chenopodium quinoa TaxID=63459 RepID=UPI000B783966|nr:AT-hook motif nuclear-localized protein 14-like [Chenopodium quinoa]
MEPNEQSGLTSYYHPHQHPHPQQPSSTLSPPLPSSAGAGGGNSPVTNGMSDGTAGALYPQTVAGKAPTTSEPQRRKRGRPRKYGTPEAAAAAKRAAVPSSINKRKEQQHHHFIHGSSSHSSSASSKKSNLVSVGGQGFTPHVINVPSGEDVGQKIMLFMQQTRKELCILSASGSISNASLRQPAISGGSIAYEGRFDIISLTGSYVRSDLGGKAGGLSACLSTTNGQIVGGGVGGPLIAAGPVEVIVATFQMDPKKDVNAGFKGDVSTSTMPSPVSASTAVYRPIVESAGGFTVATGGDDHQNMDGSPFMMQSQWRSGISYDMGGNTGHSSHDSPENGDYEQMPD